MLNTVANMKEAVTATTGYCGTMCHVLSPFLFVNFNTTLFRNPKTETFTSSGNHKQLKDTFTSAGFLYTIRGMIVRAVEEDVIIAENLPTTKGIGQLAKNVIKVETKFLKGRVYNVQTVTIKSAAIVKQIFHLIL